MGSFTAEYAESAENNLHLVSKEKILVFSAFSAPSAVNVLVLVVI